MYSSLATKYRPKTFEEIVEQNVTTTILDRAIKQRTFKHAYLFSGSSGCGKTTIARIFANKINNNEGFPIELDCASRNSVDDVRNILEDANERSIDSEYKIFILDECHMFSSAAWNAFLKGIEEPAEYTIYIFCTTEPQKIPATILNRLQKYNFARITTNAIKERLKYICQQEGFTNYELACDYIAKYADGGMRDAISFLEQCADFSTDLSLDNVKNVLGDISYESMSKLTYYITRVNRENIISVIEQLYNRGQNLKAFINQYLSFILDINKYLLFKDINMTNIPEYLEQVDEPELNIQNIIHIGSNLNEAISFFNILAEDLLELKSIISYDTSFKNTIIVSLLKMSKRFSK